LCFFLSALEYLIPKPLPFLRLGIANLPLLLALDMLPFASFVLLGALKITGQALITGTLFSYVFLFSLAGTGISALLMYALRRGLGKARISFVGISAAGALASNGVQLVLAYFLVFGKGVVYLAAPVLALGTVSGSLLGLWCEVFVRRSRWYAAGGVFPAGALSAGGEGAALSEAGSLGAGTWGSMRRGLYETLFNPGELALAGLLMMPALLFNPHTAARAAQFLFFTLLVWLSGKKVRFLCTLLVMGGIVFFNLLVPYGELLFSFGPLVFTKGALAGGLRRAVTLEGLFMLSRFSVRGDLKLPGSFGELAGESFRLFALLEGKRFSLPKGGKLLESLDRLLISLSAEAGEGTAAFDCGKQTRASLLPGRLVLLGAALVSYALIFLKF
jgi:heptaprenyl diphosphate synthase